MTTLTWLHLSDWHQEGKEFKRIKVCEALMKDIKERAAISPDLAKIDFIVFSGDVAHHGVTEEYQTAAEQFFTPLLEAANVGGDRLFIVPGNHDLEWAALELLPGDLPEKLNSPGKVDEWLTTERKRRTLLEQPFAAYSQFVTDYLGKDAAGSEPAYGYVRRFDVGGKKIAVIGLNSAWLCARNRDAKGEVNDRGYLILGEPQVYDALVKAEDAEVCIAVLHHPFDWLVESDQHRVEERLGRQCHFILRGHQHLPQVKVVRGTAGDCVVIPAGASYDRDLSPDPRYINAYNFVHLDFKTGQGVVYLRRLSYRRPEEWVADTDLWDKGQFPFTLPKKLGKRKRKVTRKEPLPPPPEPVKTPPRPHLERERVVLEGYLNALIRDNADLEPGGIKQTKVQVVLPLDEIYVSLQADRDRPDVDRRVMQEELDEIKKRLEHEEDPKEREKQYQIWAQQARTLQQALELAGPREELSNIVQRHRQVVILGEPGSGKTTLLRYLTLRFARAILADPERIFQPQDLWDDKNVWRLPDLGPVRLPVLMRISHYAEARQKEPDLALVDYLPRYFAGLQVPNADELGVLLRRLLDEGRCLVLLDGLDEIIDPTDRRNIATAIGQFAGVFRETGLPDWLARSPAFAPARVEERPEVKEVEEEQEEIHIQWDKRVPEDVRQEWEKQIKQRRKGGRRGERARQMAWELLREARYAHVGNRFVVTSRIAGYHFAGVPGDFEHYTIRRMSLDDIKLFLEKWCPAVERRIAEAPDPAQVEQRARREIDGILRAVETTPGVRRMAENPLLLRILAIIHRNEAHLPQRRVELYETATVTLLRDWHLERGTKGVAIDDVKAMSLLGPVAFYIHENRASGFLSKGETERMLGGILGRERGEDPENHSLEIKEAVRDFLKTVREHSGLFVERGEGLYGFMHLTFQEYFTARQLVSSSGRARRQILERLHLPRWREPILLAVGSLSKQFYDDTHDLLRAILDAGSDYEPVLHRDLLFAAACVGDSVNVAPVLRQEIAGRLLNLYCDRRHSGRYRLLQKQIKDALLSLCNDQGDVAVEAALAEVLACYTDRMTLTCALEAVEWLKARTPAVARALAACPDLGALTRAHQLLREVQSRLVPNSNGTRPVPTGWDAHRDDPVLARLIGAMWRYGSRDYLSRSLGLPEAAGDEANRELWPISIRRAVSLADQLIQCLGDTPTEQRGTTFWQAVVESMQDVWRAALGGSEVEAATERLMLDIVALAGNQDEMRDAAKELQHFLLGRGRVDRLDVLVEASSPTPDQAVKEFERVIQLQEQTILELDLADAFKNAGFRLLKSASAGHTLAPLFAAAASRLAHLKPLPDDDTLQASIRAVQSDLGHALLDVLRRTNDGQQYQEAALFLAFRSEEGRFSTSSSEDSEEHRFRLETVALVCSDLEGEDAKRRRWALQVLTAHTFRKHVEFTDAQRALLIGLLDGPADQATLALDILFALDVTPELLAWCWVALRHLDHPLADAVREKLDGVRAVKGTAPLLTLLDEGVKDQVLRPVFLELLRKVTWQGTETFVQALAWLMGEDTEVRHLAALLLAQQDDLLAMLRSVFVKATQERLKAAQPSPGASWAVLRDDPQVVRLLGGLWLHGWDDALTQLWVAQPAQTYVDKKHPSQYWRNFRKYPESEEVIRWLLEEAEFGQTLIPTFQQAAVRLAELEQSVVQGEPEAEHIATIQQEIGKQVDALLAQPTTLPLLRAETATLAATIRKEPIPPVAANILQSALASADNNEWFTALSRLAAQKKQQPLVVAALTEAVESPNCERRLLALTLLSDREALREAMAEVLATRFLSQTMDAGEALSGLGLLLQLKQSPAGLYPWLRSLCAPDNAHPLAVWLRQILAAHGLMLDAPPATLARLLMADDADACTAASLALLAGDLPALLVPILVEAAQSPDDRVRIKGEQQLYSVCRKLPTDGSTSAVEWLLHFKRDVNAKKNGHLGTVSVGALGEVKHEQPYWVTQWLDVVEQEDNLERKVAREGLNTIMKAAPGVLALLCATLNDPARFPTVRRSVADTIGEVLRNNRDQRSNATIHTAFTTALGDPETNVRRNVTYALQWTEGQGAWDVAQALLHTAQSEPDSETRTLALRSLGRVLHAVRGFRDVDVSKEALLRWLPGEAGRNIKEDLEKVLDLSVVKDVTDADAVLDALAHPDALGLPEETATRLRDSEEWDKLLQSTRQEWQFRCYWAETLPHLPAAIAQVKDFLSDSVMRRAAAYALACLYHGDDDRPARLRDLLPDDTTLLRAMLDAATDHDNWTDEGGYSPASHHPWAAKQIAGWVEAQPPEDRARLIDVMLDDLKKAAEGIEIQEEDEDEEKFTDPYSGWPVRRILIAVLAELSERLTYRAFTRTRDLADVVSLFACAATDPGSYSARRFAIRALGNLQQLTDQVAEVFFTACQDVSTVYSETRTAVSKFKVFGPGSLERLTAAVSSPSITVAYHAALLLGELGVSRSEELGRQGRKRVADELVQLLGEPLSERIVYDFTKGSDGERVGPLYDVIYEALVRVVAGPDAPVTPESTPSSE